MAVAVVVVVVAAKMVEEGEAAVTQQQQQQTCQAEKPGHVNREKFRFNTVEKNHHLIYSFRKTFFCNLILLV